MKINPTAALLGFIIGTLVFIVGFTISNWIVLSEHQRNLGLQQNINEKITFMDIETENYCETYDLELSIKLNEAGSTLALLEQKFGKENSLIILQKKNYTLLELKHFYSIKNYAQKCNKSITNILFFYSNHPDYLDDAKTKGYIISKLKDDNPKGIMVYSFDYDLATEEIFALKELYSISQPNIAIINENIKLAEFNDIDDVKQYL